MVSFQAIKTMLAQNANAAVAVAKYRIHPQPIVDSFKLPTIRIEPTRIPVRQAVAATAAVVATVPKARAPSPVRSEASEEALPPPTRMMVRAEAPPLVVEAPRQETRIPTPPPTPSEPSVRKARFVDPICIGIETQDAMYSIANRNTQQSLECEEARRLEARISELYKEESGRSRGWVKTKLEAFFLPRAAVGARVAAKDAFAWEKIWDDKEASAILDFVCLAKGIRVAVWKEERVIGLWPAADSSKGGDKQIPLHHVGNVGMKGDVRAAIQAGWKLVAPLSVEHGLEKLTLEELDGLAEKMGITIPSGKKVEKVRALASARMTMRL